MHTLQTLFYRNLFVFHSFHILSFLGDQSIIHCSYNIHPSSNNNWMVNDDKVRKCAASHVNTFCSGLAGGLDNILLYILDFRKHFSNA